MNATHDCSALLERLTGFAVVADDRADQVIADLLDTLSNDTNGHSDTSRSAMLPRLMVKIATGDDPNVMKFLAEGNGLDTVIKENLALIRRAQEYFDDHGVAIITALFHASLPEAYLGKRGVQVLDITGELFNNWTRRVQETGQFLVNILSPTPDLWRQGKSSLTAGEFGAQAARRVRLTHAAVRWMLLEQRADALGSLLFEDLEGLTVWKKRMIETGLESHEPDRRPAEEDGTADDTEEPEVGEKVTQGIESDFGNEEDDDRGDRGDRDDEGVESVPLNQEDLLATLGTFTTVVVRALERLGLTVSDEDREALYFLWNVVAWHLGIGDAESFADNPPTPRELTWPNNCLLPLTVDEMDCIYDRLSDKLQAESDQGRRMTKALFQELSYPLPRAVQTAPAFVARYLVGKDKADQLAIEKGGYAELAISGSGALDRLARSAHTKTVRRVSVELMSRYVTRYAVRAFIAQSRWSERGLKIDPRIAGKWGIQIPPEPMSPEPRSPLPAGSNDPMRI